MQTSNAAAAASGGGLSKVKHIILVLSGKGGVGKTTVCCQIALYLAMQKQKNIDASNSENSFSYPKIGIIDADLTGPSVSRVVGAEGIPVMQSPGIGWKPVEVPISERKSKKNKKNKNNNKNEQEKEQEQEDSSTSVSEKAEENNNNNKPTIKIMSMASLLNSAKEAIVWRGPRKDAMIKQFIEGVEWGELDYLFIDTPPGTSDEHLTLCEILSPLNSVAGAIVVTTPQSIATDDVRKELHFLSKLKMRCLGIVENMAGFVCPNCSTKTNIFSSGGGEKLSEQYETMFLGKVPIDPVLSHAEDLGVALWKMVSSEKKVINKNNNNNDSEHQQQQQQSSSPSAVALETVVGNVLKQIQRLEDMRQHQQQQKEEEEEKEVKLAEE